MKTLALIFVSVLLFLCSCRNGVEAENMFEDNGYQADTVTISGQILNFPSDRFLQVGYAKFVERKDELLKVSPDSLGYFLIKVPVINSSRIYLYYFLKGEALNLFVEPGEQVEIQADWDKKTLTFNGEHAQSHQQVLDYRLYVDSLFLPRTYMDAMGKGVSHEEALQLITAEHTKQDSLLNTYLLTHPQMSERAVFQLRATNLDAFATMLMQRKFTLDYLSQEPFPEFYIRKADSVFNILPRPYTLGGITFLCDYLDYYNEHRKDLAPMGRMQFDYLKEKKGITLTEEQKRNKDYIRTPEIKAALEEALSALSKLPEYEAAVLDTWSGGVGMVAMPEDLKELMYAHYYYWCLNGFQKSLAKENITRFQSLVKNPAIAVPVLALQRKYEEMEKQAFEDTSSFMNHDHLKDCGTGEALFTEIVKPYRGKLVVVDVWGTWCSPCKRDLKHASAIKQAMKGKDVVFLYLANSSPEKAWENVIKEFGLTGEQTVHYNLPNDWQSKLEDYLKVKSYPTYLLVDRQGKLVKQKLPRPSPESALVECLNEWLAK